MWIKKCLQLQSRHITSRFFMFFNHNATLFAIVCNCDFQQYQWLHCDSKCNLKPRAYLLVTNVMGIRIPCIRNFTVSFFNKSQLFILDRTIQITNVVLHNKTISTTDLRSICRSISIAVERSSNVKSNSMPWLTH
jgi:hypothetical protein